MSDKKLIHVYFVRSPTGAFKLAYSAGDDGFVTRQKAERLEAAGFIKPLNLPALEMQNLEMPLAEELEKEVKEDLTTLAGVRAKFGNDVAALREFCDELGVTYGKSAKRPEYFYNKIVKHYKK